MHLIGSRTMRACAWVMVVLFPLSLNAQASQAALQAKGAVTVNGNQVPGTTTVFAGDRIRTLADGSASLSAQGLMVVVPANSSLVFGDRVLDLGCGSVMVSTSIGEVVRVAGTSITPTSSEMTRFEVEQVNGALKITARDGSIRVEDGQMRELAPGQSMSRATPASGLCGPVATTVPQARSLVLLPASLAAAASALVAYCTVNGFCNESSPSAP